jgi:L-iditol 2-dehydrogenase
VKAALLKGPDDLVMAEVADPVPGPGDLVLRVRAATVCGTDLRILRGKKKKGVRYPSIIGHEFAGEVVAVGEGAQGFGLGDRVAVNPVVPCGRCSACRTGLENVCLDRKAIGYEFDGAFAELVRIPAIALLAGNVHRVPAHLSFQEAAMAEPLACCLNGQQNAGIRMGDDVLVLGGGPIGLMHALLADAAGARNVLVSEPNPRRRDRAQQLGIPHTVDPATEDPGEAMRRLTGGEAASAVIVAIGAGKLVNAALSYARKGGRVNLFAGFTVGETAAVDPNLIHYNQLLVSGASAMKRTDYQTSLGLIAGGKVAVKALITDRFELANAKWAFDVAEKGEGLKVVIADA